MLKQYKKTMVSLYKNSSFTLFLKVGTALTVISFAKIFIAPLLYLYNKLLYKTAEVYIEGVKRAYGTKTVDSM